jgi:hypothetical protein
MGFEPATSGTIVGQFTRMPVYSLGLGYQGWLDYTNSGATQCPGSANTILATRVRGAWLVTSLFRRLATLYLLLMLCIVKSDMFK